MNGTLFILTGVNSRNQAIVIATGTEKEMQAKAREMKSLLSGLMITPIDIEIN